MLRDNAVQIFRNDFLQEGVGRPCSLQCVAPVVVLDVRILAGRLARSLSCC